MVKEKNKNNSAEESKDFEKLYYLTMQENILLRDKVIGIDLTAEEIAYLKELVFFELEELNHKRPYVDDEYDAEEEKKLNNKKDEDLFSVVLAERTALMESVLLKLKFIK